MPTPIELSKTTQEQVLAGIKQSQELALSGVALWASSVAPLLTAGQPVAVALPKSEELVANSFGFAEKILASQKAFAQQVVAATAPVFAAVPVPASK